jgi:hypothetical protein
LPNARFISLGNKSEEFTLQCGCSRLKHTLPCHRGIGRCHRYGQKHDVVVVNFLNKKNAADQRVYQLLDEKFKLFSGVFGASDEVLGSIGSGIDFEKRIAGIYQKCRTEEQIQFNFDQLA